MLNGLFCQHYFQFQYSNKSRIFYNCTSSYGSVGSEYIKTRTEFSQTFESLFVDDNLPVEYLKKKKTTKINRYFICISDNKDYGYF